MPLQASVVALVGLSTVSCKACSLQASSKQINYDCVCPAITSPPRTLPSRVVQGLGYITRTHSRRRHGDLTRPGRLGTALNEKIRNSNRRVLSDGIIPCNQYCAFAPVYIRPSLDNSTAVLYSLHNWPTTKAHCFSVFFSIPRTLLRLTPASSGCSSPARPSGISRSSTVSCDLVLPSIVYGTYSVR